MVDHHLSGAKLRGDAPGDAGVLRLQICGEAVGSVVGDLDCLIDAVIEDEADHWPNISS
jgi:hypothetical protein